MRFAAGCIIAILFPAPWRLAEVTAGGPSHMIRCDHGILPQA